MLKHWGIDPAVDAVKSEGIRLVNCQSFETVYGDDFGKLEQEFGEALWHYHRVDLHRIVKELATSDMEKATPPAKINLGTPVSDGTFSPNSYRVDWSQRAQVTPISSFVL